LANAATGEVAAFAKNAGYHPRDASVKSLLRACLAGRLVRRRVTVEKN
jgi:hypothetical protein